MGGCCDRCAGLEGIWCAISERASDFRPTTPMLNEPEPDGVGPLLPPQRRYRREIRCAAPEAGHRAHVGASLSNLIASDQIHGGDLVTVDFDPENECLIFTKQVEDILNSEIAKMIDTARMESAGSVRPAGRLRRPRYRSPRIECGRNTTYKIRYRAGQR
jgi:hypothetical protein